jgi:putative transposase
MIKEWYSSSELAGKSGLAKNARNIRIKAQKENWKWRKRQGRGGGYEYHIDSLPKETQKSLKGRFGFLYLIKSILVKTGVIND